MPVLEAIGAWLPFFVGIAVVFVGLPALSWLMIGRKGLAQEKKLPRQLSMLVLTLFALIMLVVLLPGRDDTLVTDETKGDLLSLIGIAVAALVTLSSTTLAANAMSGFMLRSVRSFRPGDFVRVAEHFGRVTERGLFHVEIQTEDRDLVTLPNLFVATNPVRVVRSSGTIIAATVSLGYDVDHAEAERHLLRAAEGVGLTDPFVWITDLLDHAVAYRVCGFLEDTRTLVTARSRLRAAVLDTLHSAGIEITSPGVVYQRRTEADQRLMARSWGARRPKDRDDDAAERLVFDKAEAAEQRESIGAEAAACAERLAEIDKELKAAPDDETRASLEAEAAELRAVAEEIETRRAALADREAPDAKS